MPGGAALTGPTKPQTVHRRPDKAQPHPAMPQDIAMFVIYTRTMRHTRPEPVDGVRECALPI
ncbi:2-oxo-hepta-3-ene-1,7-dioic acid hydratase, partial [Escherichia coli]|nr:2-oxo-hepta-3-ene-1,7-dioic acid hydratase [Escherichia coli]